MEDVSAIIILFLLLWVLKSRESGGRLNYYYFFLWIWVFKCEGCLSYYHIFAIALGAPVKLKWRTSQPAPYFFYCFGYSGCEKVEDVLFIITVFYPFVYLSQEKEDEALALTILFPLLLVFDSRESEGLLSYCHTSSVTLGVQVKRKWRIFDELIFFQYFGYSSHEKVEDGSTIILLFPLL